MPATLIFRLEGPMQSWGHRSRFDNRDTGLEPTRSGVIGMLCCALGWGRNHDLRHFEHLRMGVRVDRPGRVSVDYHTAQNVIRASGGNADATVVSRRYYLADACFTVGLEDQDTEFLKTLEAALRAPFWPLFLGRRSFPLATPPCLPDQAIFEEDLATALSGRDLFRETDHPKRILEKRLLWLETRGPLQGIVRNDVPLSFGIHSRRYGLRAVERIEIVPARKEEDDVSVETEV